MIQIFSALVICLKNSKLAIYLPMLLSFALSGYSSNGLSSVGVGKTTAIDPHSHLRQPGMKMNYDVAGFVHNDKSEIEFRIKLCILFGTATEQSPSNPVLVPSSVITYLKVKHSGENESSSSNILITYPRSSLR